MVQVYDLTGKSYQVPFVRNTHSLELDMGQLSHGMYMIRIMQEGTIRIVPVIRE